VENAINTVIVFTDQIVSRDVQDDQSLQFLQIDNFLDLVDQIVAKIEFHQGLKVLEAI